MRLEMIGIDDWPIRGQKPTNEEAGFRWGMCSCEVRGSWWGPAGINCYVSAATAADVSPSHQHSVNTFTNSITGARDSDATLQNVYWHYTWASVKFSLVASKTLSWPTMYWVLKQTADFAFAALSIFFWGGEILIKFILHPLKLIWSKYCPDSFIFHPSAAFWSHILWKWIFVILNSCPGLQSNLD